MKKVFTVGVFDILHVGHIKLFENAKRHGEWLIVAVQDTDTILKYKPDSTIVNNNETRHYMVGAIRFVDEVVTYKDVDEIVKQVDFDVFAIGEDQNHCGFQRAAQWCKDHGREVVVIPRTKGISSTLLRTHMDL